MKQIDENNMGPCYELELPGHSNRHRLKGML